MRAQFSKDGPVIIAEVGSNWFTIDDCFASIVAARRVGADVVKFQAFTFEALFGIEPHEGVSRHFELPLEWLPKLRACSEEIGIGFMCTAFSPGILRIVDKYVDMHKIASSCSSWPALLDEAKATGKPVLFSTGAMTLAEVKASYDRLGPRAVPLYCVAAYPARSTDLDMIEAIADVTGQTRVGYSDHSLDYIETPRAAWRVHGACVIEKHFTAISNRQTPDSGHSLSPNEFSLMVDAIRGHDKDGAPPRPSRVGFFTDEVGMRTLHRRRIVATRAIQAGELFTESNIGPYRALHPSGEGRIFWPEAFGTLLGQRARHLTAAGESITIDNVQPC